MPHKAPSVTLLKVLIFFLFATLIFSSRLYAKTQDTPTLPLTTSVFKLSDDGTIFDGGIVVPVKLDSTPSQLPYIPSKISLEALNHTNLSTNSFSVASANATFTINFLTSGTDATGQACSSNFPANARAVFTAAANIWGSIIQSSVPVTIDACWASFSGNVLGYAGARQTARDFNNAPVANTWYPIALANSLAGSDLSPSIPDIFATFNSNFNWYYGTDGNTPSSQMDFLSVVLHEMGHGLGFSGSANYSTTTGQGTWGSSGRQYIYDNFVKDSSGNKVTTYSSPSTSLGNFLTSNNVLFTGANAVAANGGNNIKLYAPSTWESGSSYSHLDYNTFNNTSNQLMVPYISPGEALHDPGVVTKGLFKDIGWNLNGSSTGTLGKANLLSPSGTITDTTPTYTWNAVSGSTWYYLYVNQGSSNKIKKWYTASAAGCSSGSGTCSITPSTSLASGNHTWWIRTYNSSGNGPWSNGKIFNVSGSTTSGFNSQFNGDATDWYLVVASSPWTINSSNVSAQGTAGKVSSIFYQPNQYTNFEYSARIWRGSSSDNNESHATRLIIRGNPNNLDSTDGWDGYNFQITRSGFFSIWKHDNNGSTSPLQDWTSSTAIHQGSAWNTLTVWANASSLWFGINGVWVKNVTDSRFTNGNVGIGFYSGNGSDKLWVDWATLTPLGGSSQVAHSVSNRKISDKQLQLNDIANQNPIGDINGISAN